MNAENEAKKTRVVDRESETAKALVVLRDAGFDARLMEIWRAEGRGSQWVIVLVKDWE